MRLYHWKSTKLESSSTIGSVKIWLLHQKAAKFTHFFHCWFFEKQGFCLNLQCKYTFILPKYIYFFSSWFFEMPNFLQFFHKYAIILPKIFKFHTFFSNSCWKMEFFHSIVYYVNVQLFWLKSVKFVLYVINFHYFFADYSLIV